ICEELHAIYPDAKFVFRLSRNGMKQQDIPPYVIKVGQYSLKMLYHMSTAKVIVKNAQFKPYMKKFADQYYVQTWHGDRGIKRIGVEVHPDKNVRSLEGKYMDLALSGSDFGRDICFRRAMQYKGEILDVGVAKNDILVNTPEGLADQVREKLGIRQGEKVLLYAPTFRNSTTGSCQNANFSLKKLKAALEKAHNCKWRILVRGHMLNSGVNGDEGEDVSLYPDVSEILLVSDMLITDYSSIAYDFVLLDRPIIHYQADREDYVANSRMFVYDPEELPFVIAHNEEELLKIAVNPPDPVKNCRDICAFFGIHESGSAAKQAAEYIRRKLP
ncbi:MAG: CDP-glycerol glycerophosphotransferase family protein, partial [Clostridia bacterium]|nr:CDP-glycerol glycerophosphotransferase family protein [Clostridia bacterium]